MMRPCQKTVRDIRIMTLRQYLAFHGIKQTSFAATIGATQAAVSRYCSHRVPAPEHLMAITRATGGAVTANDFMTEGYMSCGVGVPDTAGPGIPRAAVPPAAARPTLLCEAERPTAKSNAAARPTLYSADEESASCTR